MTLPPIDPLLEEEEDTKEMESAAMGEFERLRATLLYTERRNKVIFKRQIGRYERLRLKKKYNVNS